MPLLAAESDIPLMSSLGNVGFVATAIAILESLPN